VDARAVNGEKYLAERLVGAIERTGRSLLSESWAGLSTSCFSWEETIVVGKSVAQFSCKPVMSAHRNHSYHFHHPFYDFGVVFN